MSGNDFSHHLGPFSVCFPNTNTNKRLGNDEQCDPLTGVMEIFFNGGMK